MINLSSWLFYLQGQSSNYIWFIVVKEFGLICIVKFSWYKLLIYQKLTMFETSYYFTTVSYPGILIDLNNIQWFTKVIFLFSMCWTIYTVFSCLERSLCSTGSIKKANKHVCELTVLFWLKYCWKLHKTQIIQSLESSSLEDYKNVKKY